MKKLFVSFTSLLREVTEGRVTPDDLKQGLFFFGCRREHALNPGAKGEVDERTWHQGRYAKAHPVIVAAVVEAERDGRAAWHNVPRRIDSPWRVLNNLLYANGFERLDTTHNLLCHYGYHNVRDAAAQQGLQVDVVY